MQKNDGLNDRRGPDRNVFCPRCFDLCRAIVCLAGYWKHRRKLSLRRFKVPFYFHRTIYVAALGRDYFTRCLWNCVASRNGLSKT